jgi:hypothetical protein
LILHEAIHSVRNILEGATGSLAAVLIAKSIPLLAFLQ